MNALAKKNHYDLLDVKPSATSIEIRHAYRMAVQMYQDDSLASYSFFSEQERTEILKALERALATLTNDESRMAYDRSLLEQGILRQEDLHNKRTPYNASLLDLQRPPNRRHMNPIRRQRGRISEEEKKKMVEVLLMQDTISGKDLRRLREALGTTIEQITEQTKIRMAYLNHLEEDQAEHLPSPLHVKSFLKQYAKYFDLDGEAVVTRYLKGRESGTKESKG